MRLVSKWAIVTKVRPNADGSLTTSSEAVSRLTSHWIHDTRFEYPMTNLATRQKFQSATAERTVRTERPARVVAVALAVVVALGLTGCSTPMLEVVRRGAEPIRIGRRYDDRTGGRLVGKLRRPGAVRPHPPRGAREPRRQDRRRARARRARRRDDQPLVAVAEHRRQRAAAPITAPATTRPSSRPFRTPRAASAGARRLVGNRPLRSACARAPRRPPPTRSPPSTARAACACWC